MSVIVQQWSPVATYHFKGVDTKAQCGFCKNNLMLQCVDCSTKTNRNCPVSRGKCGCHYHYHCISKWTIKGGSCVKCKTPYDYEAKELNSVEKWNQLIRRNKYNQEKAEKETEAAKQSDNVDVPVNC